MIEITSNGTGRGRSIKFTPERIEQIKNLVERGTSREQIAEIIGCTVGSLQVTCSRLGVSLRKPSAAYRPAVIRKPSFVEHFPGQEPTMPTTTTRPSVEISLIMRRGPHERKVDIPLPDDVISRLALEASIRGIPLGELIAEIIKKH